MRCVIIDQIIIRWVITNYMQEPDAFEHLFQIFFFEARYFKQYIGPKIKTKFKVSLKSSKQRFLQRVFSNNFI